MRIIAGKSKGRRIYHDRSPGLRPTASKVREAVFDILQAGIEGATFLDLFAGSGAVGIEALSRGASRVDFVEINKKRAKRIEEVIGGQAERRVKHNANIVCADVLKYLRKRGSDLKYDIIFADPPYDYTDLEYLIDIIYNNDVLATDGIFLLEHSSKRKVHYGERKLKLVKQYVYGDTTISKFRIADE